MLTIEIVIATIIAYLIGSVSSAIIVCKIMRLPDPRSQGSRNPGATNVLRIGGKKAAALTLLGDTLKGVVPVLLAKWYGLPDVGLSLVALFVVVGHLFPIFFHFEGGKGVATGLGSLFALAWPVGVCWVITWFIIALLFRYSSLAAIVSFLLAPIYTWYFTHNWIFTTAIVFMMLIIIFRHRQNIAKLISGKEHKIGSMKND